MVLQVLVACLLLAALPTPAGAAEPPSAESNSLEERITALEQEIRRLRQELTPDQSDLEARLEKLEKELEQLRLQLPAPPPDVAPVAASGNASPNVFNPTLTVVGNGLYRYDDRDVFVDDTRVDNQFNVREVELDLRAAVDPFADGVVIVAFPAETLGEFEAELEEGYVNIKRLPLPGLDDPPLGMKLKLGRYRTEVGRINRLHLHDLPQIDRPLVTEEFFGEDGYIGDGLSLQFFIPTPFDEKSVVELTTQILAGGGVSVADGPSSEPAFVGNLRWFRTFASAHNVDLSLLVHDGSTAEGSGFDAFTWGLDVLYKWKPLRGGEFRSFVLGGQLLGSEREFLEQLDTDGDGVIDSSARREESPLGYFAFAQHQLARNTYLGLRWDDTDTIDDDSIARRAGSGYLSWYSSEFLRFRLGYQRRMGDLPSEDGRDSVFFEVNFIFGAHPPEPFWVNK